MEKMAVTGKAVATATSAAGASFAINGGNVLRVECRRQNGGDSDGGGKGFDFEGRRRSGNNGGSEARMMTEKRRRRERRQKQRQRRRSIRLVAAAQ